ncbi:hypothetical protein NKI48_23815 [Mesorhizobium sp. M0644]|uniref:hypothetical protein n=1 Tax=unclassified Mesorhizobium TaxID=325217 RepID=UPI003337CCB3
MDPHDYEIRRVFIALHEHILARTDEAARAAALERQEWIRRAILEKLARDNLKTKTR